MISPAPKPSQSAGDELALGRSLLDIAARGNATECAIGTESLLTAHGVSPDATERVGKWEMRVALGDATPEAELRWNDRADALAAWLQSEWEREQARLKDDSR